MKKIVVSLLTLLVLTSCANKTDVTENVSVDFYVHYIDLLKYQEHTIDAIYSISKNRLDNEVSIGKTIISDNKSKYYLTIDGVESLEDISNMKVSNDNQYMAITFIESGWRATKLQIVNLKEITFNNNIRNLSDYVLYNYEIVDFNKDDIELNLSNQQISIEGFDKESKVLWGAIAYPLDISYSFVINMDNGEIELLKDIESYNKASEKYEIIN